MLLLCKTEHLCFDFRSFAKPFPVICNAIKKLRIKTNSFSTQNLFFFQPLFCQRLSAHLQNPNTKPTSHFAKELIFPMLPLFYDPNCFLNKKSNNNPKYIRYFDNILVEICQKFLLKSISLYFHTTTMKFPYEKLLSIYLSIYLFS